MEMSVKIDGKSTFQYLVHYLRMPVPSWESGSTGSWRAENGRTHQSTQGPMTRNTRLGVIIQNTSDRWRQPE